MEYRFTAEEEALRKEFDEFFRQEMKNAPRELGTSMESHVSSDTCWEFHRHMAKKLAARGWISRPWPKEYGGKDASLIEQFIFSEVIGYHKGVGWDQQGVGMLAPTLLVSANEEQKSEHLPPMAQAERFWCQLWSEPGAGSDLACLSTRAVRDGNDYVVNGQKIWTSSAHRADWGFLLARTNPQEKRSKGLSFFLVDMKTRGVTVRPVLSMNRTHMFNEVFLDDVHVPVRNRVGEENQGWLASQMTSNFERSMIGLFSYMKRELEELVEFYREKIRGGVAQAKDPLVRQRLAQLAIDIEVGRAFAYIIVWSQIKGGLVVAAPLAAAAKVLATELKQRLAYAGYEIMGLYGQVRDSRWSRQNGKFETECQQCVGLNIAGGTSEVMRNLIASLGLGLPRSW